MTRRQWCIAADGSMHQIELTEPLTAGRMHLGGTKTTQPAGGIHVVERFVGLLAGDDPSLLMMAPDWRPAADPFGCSRHGIYTMNDRLIYLT